MLEEKEKKMRILPTNKACFKGIYIIDTEAPGTITPRDVEKACEQTPGAITPLDLGNPLKDTSQNRLMHIDLQWDYKLPNIIVCNDEYGNHLTQHKEYMALAKRGKQKVSRYDYYQGLINDAKKLDAAGFKRLFEKMQTNFDELFPSNILKNHTAEDLEIIGKKLARWVEIAKHGI